MLMYLLGSARLGVPNSRTRSHASRSVSIVSRLFGLFLNGDNHRSFVGDLEERFGVIENDVGHFRAQYWFGRQVVASLCSFVWAAATKYLTMESTLPISLVSYYTFYSYTPEHSETWRCPEYAVRGLPGGCTAWIVRLGDKWKIYLIRPGVGNSWIGDYKSMNEAFVALAQELGINHGRCRLTVTEL